MSSPALNENYLQKYASNVARQICAAAFSEKEKVSGADIKKLTPVKQVNYFVIKYLFKNWKTEMKRLTDSPYFDYDHQEVKEALIQFKNKVSNHILIAEKDLEPLVYDSVIDTLKLMYSPYDFFISEIKELDGMGIKAIDERGKYLTINKNLWSGLVSNLNSLDNEEYSFEVLENQFNRVCEESGSEPDSIDHLINDLNEYQPIDESELYTERSGFNTSEIVVDEIEEIEIEEEQVKQESFVENTHEELEDSIEEKPLVDRFHSDYETLNDKVASQKGKVKTLAHQNLESIKKGLSLNQRFMFTKELFRGDQELFEHAIDKLDQCSEYNEVINLIEQEFAPNNKWNMESYEVSEFMHMINRRFPD
ncbi:hypothetical protein [Marinigracilibium pacificum]|uniref:MYG1 family protein n=1 Tax=Marinigracilibium pacificum TaxID=2729599 RepID=A0A848J233_9BACT|nr:hypothetical protein [Marinigracilibium pacificum]NMM49781.1 MYG1 family protein [Marinigracilibium pacificum]